jgi:PAS domain S-box-containing protein
MLHSRDGLPGLTREDDLVDHPNVGASPTPLEALLRLASQACGVPVQLCLFDQTPSSITTDPRAPDLAEFARDVATSGAPHSGLRWFAGQAFEVTGTPLMREGRAMGALCAFGSADFERVGQVLEGVVPLVGRELGVGHAASAPGSASEPDVIPLSVLQILDSAPIPMALYDAEFRVLRVNERWGFDFGLRPERMVGHTIWDLDPNSLKWKSQYLNCLKGERLTSDRHPLTLKDGRAVFISSVTIPWRRDDGLVGGVLGMYRLTADSSEDDFELARAQRRLEVAAALGGICVWEIDYRSKAFWCLGGEDFYGTNVAGFLDLERDPAASVHPEDRPAIATEMAAARRERRPFRGEHRMERSDREVWVAAVGADHYGEGGELETRLGVMLDITQRKQAEQALMGAIAQAEAANQAKSNFLATMSHEIRTPLNGVLGMARAMAGDELSPVQRERLEVVRQSGESLLTLLNDVLDLSKVEAGKLELDIEPFNICAVVEAAQAMFSAVAQGKGLALEMVVDDAARGTYLGDAVRLRQIIANLISNALKFTASGRVEVSILRTRDGLAIRVRDTGIGIPAERVGKLFQKFEQADASTTRRYGGTGLGLAICRELSELMGGSIEVASEEGHGSTFLVDLPLQKLEAQDVAPPAIPMAATPPVEPAGAALRVLAAEDNTVNQLVLRTLLNQAGIEPTIVGDGKAALEAWELGDWDVILMDVQMPVMDGLTATRLIRQREAQSGRAPTPIVALTANVMSHQVREYELAGMNVCVAKPIEVAALFASLEQALAMRPAPAAAQAG